MASSTPNIDSTQDDAALKKVLNTIKSFIQEKPLGAFGGFCFLIAILVAIFGPLIAPYDPNYPEILNRLQGPTAAHWMGTDQLGRDVFSRVLYGARTSIYVGVVSTIIGTAIGSVIGLTSGYIGGKFDLVVQRFMDMWMSFPPLILIICLMVALGPSINNVIIAIIVPISTSGNRVIRSVTLSVKQYQFVEAVKAVGASNIRILFRHIAPNTLAYYLIIVSSMLGGIILVEASLSFLGFGVPPPHPSWGRSLNDAIGFIHTQPLLAVWPGLAIFFVVFGVNVFGDALRDFWDPRLKKL
jgi:peptide/nickel transport system permease protein